MVTVQTEQGSVLCETAAKKQNSHLSMLLAVQLTQYHPHLICTKKEPACLTRNETVVFPFRVHVLGPDRFVIVVSLRICLSN